MHPNEEDVSAPLADCIMYLFEMHETLHTWREGADHSTAMLIPADEEEVAKIAAALLSYSPDERAPQRFLDVLFEVRPKLGYANGTRQQLQGEDAWEQRRLRDIANQATAEARYIVRHKLTLEGPDV